MAARGTQARRMQDPQDDLGITMRTSGRETVERSTRLGHPDRRIKGQRDLPGPILNSNYTPARTGGVIDDIHVTLDGKPDRRFKENRGISEEEELELHIQALQAQRKRS